MLIIKKWWSVLHVAAMAKSRPNFKICRWKKNYVHCQIKNIIARNSITVLFHICLHTVFHHLLVLYLSDRWSSLIEFNNLVDEKPLSTIILSRHKQINWKWKMFWQHPGEAEVDWLTYHKQTVFLFYSKQHVKHSIYLWIYVMLYEANDRDYGWTNHSHVKSSAWQSLTKHIFIGVWKASYTLSKLWKFYTEYLGEAQILLQWLTINQNTVPRVPTCFVPVIKVIYWWYWFPSN